MTWAAFLLAVLKALPAAIALLTKLKADADARMQQGIGRDAAVKAGLEQMAADRAVAKQAGDDADAAHAAHPDDDSAFDQDFKRND